jgi:hypothetical protein
MNSTLTLSDLGTSDLLSELERQMNAPPVVDSAKTMEQISGHVARIDPRLQCKQGLRLHRGIGGSHLLVVVMFGGKIVCEFSATHSIDPEEFDPDPSAVGQQFFSFEEVESAVQVGLRTLYAHEVTRRCMTE